MVRLWRQQFVEKTRYLNKYHAKNSSILQRRIQIRSHSSWSLLIQFGSSYTPKKRCPTSSVRSFCKLLATPSNTPHGTWTHQLYSTSSNKGPFGKDSKERKSLTDHTKHQVLNIPNVITFGRILSTPYLSYFIITGNYALAIKVLAIAGVSDWLDGFIARRFNQQSIIGSFLDPLADKLMVGSLCFSMTWSGLIPLPLAGLIFGRDFLLVTGTVLHRKKTKSASAGFFDTSDGAAFEVEPTTLSKVNTALQFSMFGLALMNGAWQFLGDPMLDILFGLVSTTTFASGIQYTHQYINETGAFRPSHTTMNSSSPKREQKK